MKDAIGGYFGLELQKGKKYLFKDYLHLNTARNCIEYILRGRKYKKVYLPFFTCDVVLEPINKLNIEFQFYDVDDNLEAIFDFDQIKGDEGVIVNNYFGIKSNYINKISSKYKNLIIDNAQALFSKNTIAVDTVYSPRKFVGIADGGFLSTDLFLEDEFERDLSYQRMSHLLKRIDLSAEKGYLDFSINDKSLENNVIKKMSNLSYSILVNIDYDQIKQNRLDNFNYLHKHLKISNVLNIDLSTECIPMVYPFRTIDAQSIRRVLIENRVYTATYWPNVLEWCSYEANSRNLTNEIIAIPIDQRYTKKDMDLILKILS